MFQLPHKTDQPSFHVTSDDNMARLFSYFLWDDVVQAEVRGPVTTGIQIHGSPTVHMFSKIRSRGASPEGSGTSDSLETFPVCSSLSQTVRTHAHTAAFHPAVEKYHMNAARTSSHSFGRAAGRTGLQHVAPETTQTCFVLSSLFCLQWGSAAAGPRVLWSSVYKVNPPAVTPRFPR